MQSLHTGIAVAAAGTLGAVGGALGGLDPAWIALIGTLFGGVVLKVAESWMSKPKTQTEDARAIREELRTQVSGQRQEIKDLEEEVNEWRGKYYDLRDAYAKIQTELMIALQSIKREAEKAESHIETHNNG